MRWKLCCFFFSSRRRHTRCSRDWSSDVCSSDLPGCLRPLRGAARRRAVHCRHGHHSPGVQAALEGRLLMAATHVNGRPARILWGNLAWHPAVAAWREFARDAPTPECIEVLKKGERCAVYRLVGAGRGGAPIIAWCSRRTRALALRTIYEKVVRRLSTRAPRFRAFRADSTGFAWLFLEEVGGGGA